MHPEALRTWVKRVESGAVEMPGAQTVSDIERVRQLEKENRELRPCQRDPQVGVGFLRGGAVRHEALE